MNWEKKHSWWLDACRLRVGLLKRPQPQVPHLTRPKYDPELAELDRLAAWFLWVQAGKHPPRPRVWRKVPVYAWTVWGEWQAKHPKPPAPPPPPASNPPSRWRNTPWTKPHVDISHGLRSSDPVWTVDQLVRRCLQYGARAVGFQCMPDCPDPDWARHGRELYEAGKAAGLQVYGWGRCDYFDWATVRASVRAVLPLDGFSADIEGRCVDQNMPQRLVDEFADECPLSVVATGGIDESIDGGVIASAVAWGDWFDFRGQDYLKQGAEVTPDMGENFVWWRSTDKNGGRGFRRLPDADDRWHVPLVMPNAETCPGLAAYEPLLKRFAPHFGVWDGELVEAHGEWDVFARLAAA